MVGGLPNSAARVLAGALRLGTSMPKSPGALGGRSITALHTTFSRVSSVPPESLCQVGARKVSVVAYPQLSKAPASNALVQALSQKASQILMPPGLFKKYLQADTPAASVVAEKALPAEIPAALEEPVSPITGLISQVNKTLGDTSKGLQGRLEAIMQATGKSEVAVIAELRTDVEGLDALRLGTTVTSEDGLNKLGEKVIAFNEKYGFKPDLSTDAKKQQYIARLSNSIAGTDYKSSGVDWRFFVGRSSEDASKKILSTAIVIAGLALGAMLQKSELAPEDAQARIDEELATTPLGRLLESPASKAGRKFEPQYKKTMALLNKYNEFDKKLKEEVAKGIKIEEEFLTLSTGTGPKQIEKKVQDRLALHAKWQPLIDDTILPENELAKSKEWASLQDPAQMKALEQEGATLSSLQKEIEAAQEGKNIDPELKKQIELLRAVEPSTKKFTASPARPQDLLEIREPIPPVGAVVSSGLGKEEDAHLMADKHMIEALEHSPTPANLAILKETEEKWTQNFSLLNEKLMDLKKLNTEHDKKRISLKSGLRWKAVDQQFIQKCTAHADKKSAGFSLESNDLYKRGVTALTKQMIESVSMRDSLQKVLHEHPYTPEQLEAYCKAAASVVIANRIGLYNAQKALVENPEIKSFARYKEVQSDSIGKAKELLAMLKEAPKSSESKVTALGRLLGY